MKKLIKLVFGQVNRSIEFKMKEGIRSALTTLYLAPAFVHVLCLVREINRLDLGLGGSGDRSCEGFPA